MYTYMPICTQAYITHLFLAEQLWFLYDTVVALMLDFSFEELLC